MAFFQYIRIDVFPEYAKVIGAYREAIIKFNQTVFCSTNNYIASGTEIRYTFIIVYNVRYMARYLERGCAIVSEIRIEMHMKQIMRLSPQMIQSARILQMDAQELREFANNALEENPVLDRLSEQESQREFQELCCSFPWLGSLARSASDEQHHQEQGAPDRRLTSLTMLLMDQLARKPLSDPLRKVCRYLVQALDEDGYLEQEDLDTLYSLGVPKPLVQQAVETLQSLEPAGIAACNLRECLLLQLRRLPQDTTTAQRMVRDYLDVLGKKRWHMLADALHVEISAVQQAAKLIESLSPHPGRAEDGDTVQPEYIIPDVFVVEMCGIPQLVLNDYYVPRIGINGNYTKMLAQEVDAETKEFLREKIQHARWVMDCLERRRKTLERCAQLILKTHLPFFQGATPYLAPLTQKEAAAQLDLHESTVGRCLQGKYLQCRQGTYPLQYFFPHAVDAAGQCSEQMLRLRIMTHIREEDGKHPLSDQRLSELLAGERIFAARRTVTKYRNLLGIPPAYIRRQ